MTGSGRQPRTRRPRARRLPAAVVVEARAKLNLGLAIGPRRPDGFHDLATVFQSISLADTLIARRAPRGFSLTVRREEAAARGRTPRRGSAAVPRGPSNLVLRAARLVSERLGLPGGARFTLVKRIPARAGLGGGSADAAAAIVALLALHGARLPRARRLALAAELGSDVPFACLGGTALGLGRGERLARKALVRPFRALVAVPRWRVSTARAFARFDRFKYGLTHWKPKLRSAKAVGRERVSPTRALRLGNDFEGVLGTRRRDFVSLCSRLSQAGALEPRLTGSGSAVFGLIAPGAAAREVLERFAGPEALFVVRSRATGLHWRPHR